MEKYKRWCAGAVSTPSASTRGWAWFTRRVYCASGFRNLNSSDGEIQALVRWSSVDSIRIYARMGLVYQARRRDLLQTATIDAMNAAARPLPQYDFTNDDVARDAEAATEMAAALELAAQRE